ncbi:MAG: hypothetical protein Q4E64_10145 [Phascolarctobacterium sp.]|uniref:hypothetical protein n=1 Tax=Phascolarctobacterium sp. TaxID=2049039 RepID=UPI0026DD7B4D|nr:hypothetical protein [Phascolarctobacterium sp.]MDO4922167.1 hypothetical protein [Phascolarctobacterium sp.]
MRQLTTTALLGVIILLSGSMKIPSPVAGGEFQLSAPIAVLICACFGFKRYIIAGLLASALGMTLGVHNIFSVLIQMCFRAVAGGVMALMGTNLLTVIVSGPLGTLFARIIMWQVTGVSWQVLAAAAAPGMIFTAATAGVLYKPAQRLLHHVELLRQN